MQNLGNFFKNPILIGLHSFGDEQRFGEEHIGKLTAQNTNGQYDAILASTLTAHNDYFGDFTNVKIKEAIQQSQTQKVDAIIADFKLRTSRLNNYLIAGSIDKTPIYQVFFPFGVGEFTKDTNKANAESHIDRLLSAIMTHTTEAGGASVLTEYQDFKSNYSAARTFQLVKKGETSSTRSSRDQKRLVWANQIFLNLLSLAQAFPNQPEKVNDFFTQSILRLQSHADHDGKGQLSGTILNALSQEPETGVNIHIIDGNIPDMHSKADGRYRSRRLPVGLYSIVVSKTGLPSQTLSVYIEDEGDTVLDVKM